MKKDNSYKVHFAGCHTREMQQTLIGLYLREKEERKREQSGARSEKIRREVAAMRARANRMLNPLYIL